MSERRPITAEQHAHLKAIAAKGGAAANAKRLAAQAATERYRAPFLDFLDATGRSGPSRAVWRVFWKAADGLPLTADELVVFQRHTGRSRAPTTPPVECWVIAGRGAGKSVNLTERGTHRAISFDRAPLAAGEQAVIPLIASDRRQAMNTMHYLRGLAGHPLVAPYVARVLAEAVEFRTGVVVSVHTAHYAALRGYSMIDAIAEEVAFWAADDRVNADVEILGAIRPALIRVPGSRLYGISSPYARRGILWQMYERYWGQDDADVLVFCADTASLNPTVDTRAIAREFESDPARAMSEYGQDGLVAFRGDVESFFTPEAIDGVRMRDRLELPPLGQASYVAFVDPSGGSRDSFTLAIAHAEGERAVLDCVREVRPPFSPDDVCAEFAATLKTYRVYGVRGDHYAGEWPRERFRVHGIEYTPAEHTKSELYLELLPVVNAGRVELLDLVRLRTQLLGLERRTARSGKDSVDHAPGGHDDVANAAAGALVQAIGGIQQTTEISIPDLRRAPRETREAWDPVLSYHHPGG